MTPRSLRARLLVLLLVPLVLLSALIAAWRFADARATAEVLFDRTLLSSAFAISRDVALTDGDMLSLATWDMLSDAAGGQIFYHVGAPDGAFVIGYATPPVPPSGAVEEGPYFYDAVHLGEPVRAVRLRERIAVDGVSGFAVVTAWQRLDARAGFARGLGLTTLGVLGLLLAAVAGIVWFGVRRGLRPLDDLEEAIRVRSGGDLAPIARPVPVEIGGVVRRLNALFGEVREAMAARDAFISDAAHQLRNPVAGVLGLAEAAQGARTEETRRERIGAVVEAARGTARLAGQMLSYERARGGGTAETFDLGAAAARAAEEARRFVEDRGLSLDVSAEEVRVSGDPALIGEAVRNVIENAAVHSGGTAVAVHVGAALSEAVVSVEDDGRGLPPEAFEEATRRFGQMGEGQGTGLGLAIARAVCERHGGRLVFGEAVGALVELRFPLAK